MNGLLVRHAEEWKNIGDYIQSLAQEQYWDHIDLIVDREHTDTATSPIPGEKINLIMNSWWMWSPESFPPSEDINPLFISFHISPKIAERMLSEKSVAYLKRYQPIGARDTSTQNILKRHGIQSYFSGCLTLTLGRTYRYQGPREKVYIVDPEYKLFAPRAYKDWFRALFNLVRWRKKIKCLAPKFNFAKKTTFSRFSEKLNRKICATLFFDQYRKYFREELLLEAEYLTHQVDVKHDYPTDQACLDYARVLIGKYSRAKMVITSRIHAALPSLGLDTPVFFTESWMLDSGDIKGRLGGLLDFFDYRLKVTDHGLMPATSAIAELVSNGPISYATPLQNSDAYIPYCKDLIAKAEEFVRSCSNTTLSENPELNNEL